MSANTQSKALVNPYAGYKIQPEFITLDPESPQELRKGEVIARALDGFMFLKGTKYAYPHQGADAYWWRGIIAFGFVTPLCGSFKYFTWSGHWGADWEEKHLETIIITNIVHISKERNINWRNGTEEILWIETKHGYSYALLEPDAQYNGAIGNASPAFKPLPWHSPRPAWWDALGDEQWEYLVNTYWKSDASEAWLDLPTADDQSQANLETTVAASSLRLRNISLWTPDRQSSKKTKYKRVKVTDAPDSGEEKVTTSVRGLGARHPNGLPKHIWERVRRAKIKITTGSEECTPVKERLPHLRREESQSRFMLI
ncbi:hypothetical protein RHS01_10777 [Rhizoctonia solani]|uniref:Uncharacterized protein n=1 Tax=Rhizoctonia solani TaxID=456999 RepID=A0A8H7LZM0_9AGAM|nr:hypothetical protein RHS01_10777 [Rhizoctonia solani]